MTQTPHITVLIPTRERADVLRYCLETVTAQRYDRLQILVSDNFSSDETRDVVLSNTDSRIRYIRTPHRMGMSEHWEWALAHVQPGWLGIVGDDDGLTADCIDNVVEVASEPDADALRTSVANFQWPGCVEGSHTGTLTFTPHHAKVREFVASEQLWRDALDGAVSFLRLPVLYTGGWVRMSCLHTARDPTGRFYKSFNPDLYSGVALSKTARKVAYVGRVLAINGCSRHSNGAAHLRPDSMDALQRIRDFWSETAVDQHSGVPRLRNGRLSMNSFGHQLECLLHASHLFPNANLEWANHVERAILSHFASHWTNRSSLEAAWTKDLAQLHGVDYVKAWRAARRRRLAYLMSPRVWRSKFCELANRQIVETAELKTVADAARCLDRMRDVTQPLSNRAVNVIVGVFGAAKSAARLFALRSANQAIARE